MLQFECLYFLENLDLQLIEVKRIDLPDNAEVADRFKWLRIDRHTLQISQLNFAAMDSAGVIEERYFLEGYLKFDERTGTYIEKFNSAQHSLNRILDFKLSTLLVNAIDKFLQQPTIAKTIV